ncbi:MAG: hypothetical protein UY19_C0009G0027 [Candidatus Wolfebacteria bacterium GW2011_GWA2_47_9b]|uniref:Uncharacterized protein n=1 Tax=Candidatus Wolfebacteria bacterium GW2011_GWA2_47_9b TaxID=1619005 RepID=A0A0G1WHH5_9BACT|nr:MAG: hypothetical protein UX76_C0009G0021 [Candidatus Wolfebacteria bacterium GW2011_GWC1_47_103]KKU72973.1 MAG: hypothetical protein UX96_C0011G0022 [Candidatus Wolfebacteria bacterium GW2011_GWB1_47_243]KKU89778.1 MAG: hypothetical protein UY19_C0009G0027 [Candidatus Wolfebacteria bacterium GW2011_GWA2_47_9b]
MRERLKRLVLKTSMPQGIGGSNPLASSVDGIMISREFIAEKMTSKPMSFF